MHTFFNNRTVLFISMGLGGFCIGAAVLFLFFQSDFTQSQELEDENNWLYVLANEEEGSESNHSVEEVEVLPEKIMVDVKGEVNIPGLYELEEGERVLDAIEAAGGITEEANAALLNYAQICRDEMVIYVPSYEEEDEVIIEFQQAQQSQQGNKEEGGRININTALEEELTTLSGIGQSKATAIIQYREEHGLFQSPEELTNVSGIGEKTLENLIDHITAP